MRKETILKNGTHALNLYSDRTQLYIVPSGKCRVDMWKDRSSTYGDQDAHRGGQVNCLLLQAAKSALKSGLSKRCLDLTRR